MLLTEHKIDENQAYIFAINYHNTPMETDISLPKGYAVETLYGEAIEDGILKLPPNDGSLIKLTKINRTLS